MSKPSKLQYSAVYRRETKYSRTSRKRLPKMSSQGGLFWEEVACTLLGQNCALLAYGKCFMSKVKFDKNPVLSIAKFQSPLLSKNDICVIHRPGGPYWEKLCPRSRVRPEAAILEIEGTVFPNTDQPRPVNNIFIYF